MSMLLAFEKIIKDPSPLCDKIKKICNDKGLLFKELYRLSGYKNRVNYLSSWKKGTAPELDTLECLAHGLGITLASLLDQQETVDTVAKRALFCQICSHEGLKYKGIAFCDQHKAEYLKHSENGCKYFGNKIKQLIHDLGLTQKDAAVRFGISRDALANFIGGVRPPAPEKLCILAAGFEKPLSYFFNKDNTDESDILTQTPENEMYSINTSAASTITAHIPYVMQLPTMHTIYVSALPCTIASPMEFGSYEQNLPMNDQNNYSPYAQSIAEYVALTNAEQRDIWEDFNMHPTDDDSNSSDSVLTNELNISQDEDVFFDPDAASNFFDTLPMLEEVDR